jgi:hypothetical protein
MFVNVILRTAIAIFDLLFFLWMMFEDFFLLIYLIPRQSLNDHSGGLLSDRHSSPSGWGFLK